MPRPTAARTSGGRPTSTSRRKTRPGGADFGHIDLAHQRELKLRVLLDSLQRIGGIDDVPVAMDEALPALARRRGHRRGDARRNRLAHAREPARRRRRPRRTVRRAQPPGHRGRRPAARDRRRRAGGPAACRDGEPGRIDLVQPADGECASSPVPSRRSPRGRRGARDAGRPRAGASGADAAREVVVERVDGREFRVDAGGFWQVHRLAAHSLSRRSRVCCARLRADGPAIDPEAWHLDLYGGVGLFAATLGDLGGPTTRVTSVESDPRATEHAGENLADWVGARAETGARRPVARRALRSDGIRSRARAAVARRRRPRPAALRRRPRGRRSRSRTSSPPRVVYVACDPVALARDLATFRAARVRDVDRVHALDLFPNSHHVEAVAVLTREPQPR